MTAGRALAALLVLVAASCGDMGLAELEVGRLAQAEVVDRPEALNDDAWMLGLELVDRGVEGRRRILVELAPDDVTCADGSPATIDGVAVGDEVRVERADRPEVPRAVPPIIGGRLVIDCT